MNRTASGTRSPFYFLIVAAAVSVLALVGALISLFCRKNFTGPGSNKDVFRDQCAGERAPSVPPRGRSENAGFAGPGGVKDFKRCGGSRSLTGSASK